MHRGSVLALYLLLTVGANRADSVPVTVNVTQRVPIETLSPSGQLTNVTESTVGTRFILVNVEGQQLTLQDAQGTHYRIVLTATNYIPPVLPTTSPSRTKEATEYSPLPAAITNTDSLFLPPSTPPPALNALVADHPEILTLIKRNDEIWKWLERRFYNNGHPVLWSTDHPTKLAHYLSSHTYTKDGTPILMLAKQMPDGSSIPPEEVLALIVFELFNSGHRDEFINLDNEAHQKKVSRSDYIRGMARIEHKTTLELKDFYAEHWVHYAIKNHLPYDGNNWQMGASADFDQWLYFYALMHEGYPDDIYGLYYDALVK